MQQQVNDKPNMTTFFKEIFEGSKMKPLITGNDNSNFSDRFRQWLNQYTKDAKEKIWMDIESYHAG